MSTFLVRTISYWFSPCPTNKRHTRKAKFKFDKQQTDIQHEWANRHLADFKATISVFMWTCLNILSDLTFQRWKVHHGKHSNTYICTINISKQSHLHHNKKMDAIIHHFTHQHKTPIQAHTNPLHTRSKSWTGSNNIVCSLIVNMPRARLSSHRDTHSFLPKMSVKF